MSNPPFFSDELQLPAAALQRVRELHARVSRGAIEMTLCGALAGLELAPFRELLRDGSWTHWVETECGFSARSASSYLDKAANATAVLSAALGRPATPEEVRAALEAALGSTDEAARAALVEGCRRGLPPAPPEPRPAKPRAARPPAPPERVATRFVSRITTAPEPVRVAIFTALLASDSFVTWLTSHLPQSTIENRKSSMP